MLLFLNFVNTFHKYLDNTINHDNKHCQCNIVSEWYRLRIDKFLKKPTAGKKEISWQNSTSHLIGFV